MTSDKRQSLSPPQERRLKSKGLKVKNRRQNSEFSRQNNYHESTRRRCPQLVGELWRGRQNLENAKIIIRSQKSGARSQESGVRRQESEDLRAEPGEKSKVSPATPPYKIYLTRRLSIMIFVQLTQVGDLNVSVGNNTWRYWLISEHCFD